MSADSSAALPLPSDTIAPPTPINLFQICNLAAGEAVSPGMQIALNPAMIGCVPGETTLTELDDINALDRVYRPRLLRFVAYSTGDQDLAETIVQDCLLKAYNARGSFRGDCSVGTWLTHIANNLIRDHLRTRKFQFWRNVNKTAPDLSEMAHILPSRESSPETQILARERAQQVSAALQDLSHKQRTVFLMRFIEEMDLPDIAEATGMQVNTVKTHLHRAVKAVRIKLGGTAS
jgi:RNA polymerase sigma-70 factor, ECF subfamily